MKIWMVNHYAVSPRDPAGTRHAGLAHHLNARGHSVTVIASQFRHGSGASRPESASPVTWERFGDVQFCWLRTPHYKGNSIGRLWNMLVFAYRVWTLSGAAETPDIVYGSTPSLFAALASYWAARRLRVPFVLEVRDIWPETLFDMGVSRRHPLVLLLAAIERYLYRNADTIVTVLPNAAPHMVARGASANRIHWIPNGVELDSAPWPAPCVGREEFVVMYAGAHGPANNLETAVRAAAELQRRGSRVRFRFVGSGASKESLVARASAEGLKNVSFEAPVPKSEVHQLLQQADALLVILKAMDVFSFGVSMNKLYDSMAAGRPILYAVRSSNCPVRDADCGLQVEPENPGALADAIEMLARLSAEQRWEMGLRGRRYVEAHHDLSKLAGKLERILLDVTADLHGKKTAARGEAGTCVN